MMNKHGSSKWSCRSRLWNKTLYFASKIWKLASNITFMPKKWHLTIKKVAEISFEICEKIKEIKFIFMMKSSSSVLPWWSFQTSWPDLVTFCFSQSDPLFVDVKFRSFWAKKSFSFDRFQNFRQNLFCCFFYPITHK